MNKLKMAWMFNLLGGPLYLAVVGIKGLSNLGLSKLQGSSNMFVNIGGVFQEVAGVSKRSVVLSVRVFSFFFDGGGVSKLETFLGIERSAF